MGQWLSLLRRGSTKVARRQSLDGGRMRTGRKDVERSRQTTRFPSSGSSAANRDCGLRWWNGLQLETNKRLLFCRQFGDILEPIPLEGEPLSNLLTVEPNNHSP